jgi:hypothetical protein
MSLLFLFYFVKMPHETIQLDRTNVGKSIAISPVACTDNAEVSCLEFGPNRFATNKVKLDPYIHIGPLGIKGKYGSSYGEPHREVIHQRDGILPNHNFAHDRDTPLSPYTDIRYPHLSLRNVYHPNVDYQ